MTTEDSTSSPLCSPFIRPALVIPIHPDGRPHLEARAVGKVLNLSADDVTLHFQFLAQPLAGDVLLGVEGPDDRLRWAGATVAQLTTTPGGTRVLCRFGGRGQWLLQPQSLAPRFDRATLRYVHGIATEILDAWAELGVLRQRSLGLVARCPVCGSSPAFRPGCGACGCSLTTAVGLLRHERCGHVALAEKWHGKRFHYCAACGEYGLASTEEFVIQEGHLCSACGFVSEERALFGHCHRCCNYFPAKLAEFCGIPAYEVQRLEPVAVAQ